MLGEYDTEDAFKNGFDKENVKKLALDCFKFHSYDCANDYHYENGMKNVNDLLNRISIQDPTISVTDDNMMIKYRIMPLGEIQKNLIQFRSSKNIPFEAKTNMGGDHVIFITKTEKSGSGGITEMKRQTDEFMNAVLNGYKEEIEKLRNEIEKECKNHFDVQNEVYNLTH